MLTYTHKYFIKKRLALTQSENNFCVVVYDRKKVFFLLFLSPTQTTTYCYIKALKPRESIGKKWGKNSENIIEMKILNCVNRGRIFYVLLLLTNTLTHTHKLLWRKIAKFQNTI
jgi:hypothetical protein